MENKFRNCHGKDRTSVCMVKEALKINQINMPGEGSNRGSKGPSKRMKIKSKQHAARDRTEEAKVARRVHSKTLRTT